MNKAELKNKLNRILDEFDMPLADDEGFFNQTLQLLDQYKLDSLSDDELFQLVFTSFNIFFFAPIDNIDTQFTEECNLRCDYCFVQDKRKNRFSPEIGKGALDFLVMNSGPVMQVSCTFFGGEPLLEFDTIHKVLEYGSEISKHTGKKISYSATTNGVLLNEDILKRNAGRINFLLSIDGDEKTHDKHRKTANGEGSFKHVFPKIGLLKQYQPWLGTRMTVCPDTVDNLAANIDFLYRNGINQFLIGPAIEMTWDETSFRKYDEQIRAIGDYYLSKKANGEPFRMAMFEKDKDNLDCYNGMWGCWAGRNHVVITYNGDIYPCSKFLGLEHYNCEEFRFGNIFEGLTNLKAREQFYNMKDHQFAKCQGCNEINSCTGGCPADNFFKNRTLFNPAKNGCTFTEIHNRIVQDLLNKSSVSAQLEQVS